MPAIHDGPASPYFSPLPFKIISPGGAGSLSPAMEKERSNAPGGACVCWGIPFEVDELLVVAEHPVVVEVSPTQAPWLVFLHTSDARPLEPGPGGIISPMTGLGHLAEHAADYVLCYADGTEERATIRRRHQLGPFQRHWGENCFQCVAHHKPYSAPAAQDQPSSFWGFWGVTQMRVGFPDDGLWMNWLWAWQNPHPEKKITGLRFEPAIGQVVIAGLAIGDVESLPLRWETRRKVRLLLPEGEAFQPDMDGDGLLKQVQLDLGQVISARRRLVYPNETWAEGYNNQLPQLSPDEILLEYTAHPQACFHLALESGEQVIPLPRDAGAIPLANVEAAADRSTLCAVPPALQTVNLRVVEKGKNSPVAVKLHVHGQWGEYLAPVDRHRILNPAWFEDYSADFYHMLSYDERAGGHPCTYINGVTRLKLPQGKVYIEISKGFEIRPVRQEVEVTPETEEIVIELEKVLPWRQNGWVTADTHVHFLSPMTANLEGAGEGVNVVNLLASQWGEMMSNLGDFDGRNTWGSKEAGGNGEYLVRVGTENRQHVLGHISLLGYTGPIIAPMTTGGPDEAALGDPVEALLVEWARQCRRQGGLVVLPHFPRPRADGATAIVSGEVDAVEMTSWENHYSGIDPYSLSDWYRYLNCGYMVAAVGGTDKMTNNTAVGTVCTYARIAPGTEFTYESWKDAVRRHETFASYGPLLEFMVAGVPMGSRINLGRDGGTLDVTWQVASVTVPVTRVELVVNGEIRQSQALPPAGASGSWSFKTEKSCWLALLVRGHQPGKPEMIAAHSSPVMVMLEDSPLMAAADAVTILDQIEGALAYLDTVGTRAGDRAYKRMRLELQAAQRSLHNRMHQGGVYHEHSNI